MSFWPSRPVLVTGGTGLLGSWLVQRLVARGASVTCVSRTWPPRAFLSDPSPVEGAVWRKQDIRDTAALEALIREREISVVFHAAAQAIVGEANRNPVSTFEVNAAAVWNLLDACRKSGTVKQVVVTSSDKAYGHQPTLPYREEMGLLPRHPYEASKACGDLIAQAYGLSYDLPVAVTRCGNFFGGGDLNWNRIVPGTIRALLNGERPLIRSDGMFVRDYLYVEDAADAHLLLAEKLGLNRDLSGQAFNFSHEVRLTVLDLVGKIARALGSNLLPRILNEASGEIREQYLNCDRARKQLGWQAVHSVDEGLIKSVAWYRAHCALGGGPHS